MATLADLTARRDALATARHSGNRRVKTGATEIEFKSDSEMAAALADLDREIAAMQSPVRMIVFTSSKGF